jgi:hypothetical protein
MNKNLLTYILLLGVASNLLASDGGPMNATAFYDEGSPFKQANDLYQERKWRTAEKAYRAAQARAASQESKSEGGTVTDYQYALGQVNSASCKFAQRQSTPDWVGFDVLIGIKEEQRLPVDLNDIDDSESILVRSGNGVGFGDLSHFTATIETLRKQTDCKIIFSVRPMLIYALRKTAEDPRYNVEIVSEKAAQPKTTYITHLVSLLGHLNITPAELIPSRVIFTTSDEAIKKTQDQIDPFLAAGQRVVAVFLGEKRPATLIGGKQLPHDETHHGRELSSSAFEALLKAHDEVVLLDCGTPKSRIQLEDQNNKDRLHILADETDAFDTTFALGYIMSKIYRPGNKQATSIPIVGMGADNGPTNMAVGSIGVLAQDKFAFFIPNGQEEDGEYDMRMEGNGSKYKQMLSNCWVYKCETPEQLTTVVERAYNDLINQ